MERAKAVYLEWVDSAGFPEWQTQAEVDALVPYACRTVGLLIKEDVDCLVVAVAETMDMGEAGFQKVYNGIMSIPRSAVLLRYDIDLTIQDEEECPYDYAHSYSACPYKHNEYA